MASSRTPARPVVLVVDDEPIIRFHLADLVEAAGFEVIEASGADQAIEILLARTDVRILMTDVDMPGSMDGLRLAAAVRDRWPPIEIIVLSGKVRPPLASLPERGQFLEKPFSDGSVVTALRRSFGHIQGDGQSRN